MAKYGKTYDCTSFLSRSTPVSLIFSKWMPAQEGRQDGHNTLLSLPSQLRSQLVRGIPSP